MVDRPGALGLVSCVAGLVVVLRADSSGGNGAVLGFVYLALLGVAFTGFALTPLIQGPGSQSLWNSRSTDACRRLVPQVLAPGPAYSLAGYSRCGSVRARGSARHQPSGGHPLWSPSISKSSRSRRSGAS